MCNLVNWNCESSITLEWYQTFVFVLKFGSFLAVGILGPDIVQKVETENSGTADGKRHIDYCCIAAFVF